MAINFLIEPMMGQDLGSLLSVRLNYVAGLYCSPLCRSRLLVEGPLPHAVLCMTSDRVWIATVTAEDTDSLRKEPNESI